MSTPNPSVQSAQVSLVYVATCSVNGKRYVGITSRGLRERVRKHVRKAIAGSDLVFHRALRKHGPDNFEWQVAADGLLWKDACAREQALIIELGSHSREWGYNVTDGGEGALGMTLPQESRNKVSATLKAWYASNSPEAQNLRQKISSMRRETPVSLETRMKLSRALRGRVLSETSRAKLSASKLLYPEDLRVVAVRIAEDNGYRAAERLFGIPRQTIRRWSKAPEERVIEKAKMLERHRTRQYGYAFPTNDYTQMKTQTQSRSK